MVVISAGTAGLVWPDRCISGERVEWSGITSGNMLGLARGVGGGCQ